MATAAPPAIRHQPTTADIRLVIAASSLGTVFEWYDFFIYGTLAAMIGRHSSRRQRDRAIADGVGGLRGRLRLPARSARSCSACLGDKLGRKYTFLVTITLMGIATAGVGLVPSVPTIGLAAPAIVMLLRILQGLALGGEYGGAAIYVSLPGPAHVAGHAHALLGLAALTAPSGAGGDGAGRAVLAFGAVRGALAAEVMALHDAGEPLALAGADHIHKLHAVEDIDIDVVAGRVSVASLRRISRKCSSGRLRPWHSGPSAESSCAWP